MAGRRLASGRQRQSGQCLTGSSLAPRRSDDWSWLGCVHAS